MTPELLADRYELTERLAGGGMGQVWRGRDRVLQRIVAIKTVDLAGQDQTARERFRREAVATAGLSTPQVVQVFDAGFDGDTAFLVMELLTGPSLSERLHAQGPLDVAEGLMVAREVARGLIAAHRIGVVHRDIKPGNVMFHNQEVKLVDFGIAQLSENAGATLTAPATALGTAAYMSPEQASGRQATEAVDWYALGCLLMTIFTGRAPFSGEALAVANQQINADPPRLAQRRPDLPLALDALIAALLAKDPAARPSGLQVLDQLRALEANPDAPTTIATVGTAAVPAPPRSTAVLPQRRTRTSYAETPSEPAPEPYRRPVAAVAAPPAGARPAGRIAEAPAGSRKRSRWPWLVVVLMLLAAGVAAAVSMLPALPIPGTGTRATPTVTPTRSASARPTTTRSAAPTATRAATSRPPTTASTTKAPSPIPTGDSDQSSDEASGEGSGQSADQSSDQGGNSSGKGRDKKSQATG